MKHDSNALKRERWRRKPSLRKAYERFYALIGARLRRDLGGPIVELGSGLGQARLFIPDVLTTDLSAGEGLDAVEDVYALTFADGSVANVIMMDVWHHIEYPGAALREIARVLRPGGRLLVLEPDMGWLPRCVYGLLHPEPLGLRAEIQWLPPAGQVASSAQYFAAQGRCYRVFVLGEGREQLGAWRTLEVLRWSDLAYLASGGYSGPQLYPSCLTGAVSAVDRCLTAVARRLCAARMLVVLERRATGEERAT